MVNNGKDRIRATFMTLDPCGYQRAVWEEAHKILRHAGDGWRRHKRIMEQTNEAYKIIKKLNSPTSIQDKYQYC